MIQSELTVKWLSNQLSIFQTELDRAFMESGALEPPRTTKVLDVLDILKNNQDLASQIKCWFQTHNVPWQWANADFIVTQLQNKERYFFTGSQSADDILKWRELIQQLYSAVNEIIEQITSSSDSQICYYLLINDCYFFKTMDRAFAAAALKLFQSQQLKNGETDLILCNCSCFIDDAVRIIEVDNPIDQIAEKAKGSSNQSLRFEPLLAKYLQVIEWQKTLSEVRQTSNKIKKISLAEADEGVKKYLKENRGFTLRDLAEKIGCSKTLVANTPTMKVVESHRKKMKQRSVTTKQLTSVHHENLTSKQLTNDSDLSALIRESQEDDQSRYVTQSL